MNANATTELTAESKALFCKLANDACNWVGNPMVDVTPANRGNLTDLKKKGLITTFTDEGIAWVTFTESGIVLAEQLGVHPASIRAMRAR
jgi:hypothetical protein